MVEIRFHDTVEDERLKFAVIISRANGRWVFCKHRDRETYEIPGGHRENGESIVDTARRELYEETGALDFSLMPVCAYSVTDPDHSDDQETFGMIFFSEILQFEKELHSEIEKIIITELLPEKWTYPLLQPKMIEEAKRRRIL